MSEEYGNDFVTLIDEDGNEVEFEHIDTVEYEGVTYLADRKSTRLNSSHPK